MNPSARTDGGTNGERGTDGRAPSAPPQSPAPVRWTLGALAALLLLGALFLPIWRSNLAAPQYPDGLTFVAYGTRVEGDLYEIDTLNHYVGMRPFRTDDIPEMALWPFGMAAAFGAVAVAGFTRRGTWPRRLALAYLWGMPVGILAVIQVRLYQFGHDLDPAAAFRMDGFTPLVIGPTTVWNFTAWSMPGGAIYAMLGAAAVVTFGPALVQRLSARVGVAAVVAAVAFMAAPGATAADDGPADLATLIAATPDGDTLVLEAGTYRGDVTIDRTITIEGRGDVVVRGSGTANVVTISAPGTVIRGLHVTGSGPGPTGGAAGVRVEADDVRIENVTITDAYAGIYVARVSRIHLVDNQIRGRGGAVSGEGHAVGTDDAASSSPRGDGISLWDVDGALVRGNVVEDTRDAVFVSYGTGALIDGNDLHANRYAIHTMFARDIVIVENRMSRNLSAAVLMYGGPALVLRNEMTDSSSPSTGFGVLLKDIADVEVVENIIVRNRAGLHVDGPSGGTDPITFTANTIARNQVGAVLYPATDAVFMANSFVDNVVQVLQQGRGAGDGVRWSDRGHGNYWSTYTGFDNGRGRGSTPHLEGSSVERLLVRSPVLMPLASSPALRIVRAVEERWSLRRPVLVDPLPLTQPLSPAVPKDDPEPVAQATLAAAALVLLAAAGSVLRSTRRRPTGAAS